MTPIRVGVIGAGLAGPVLATMLKRNGYEPVVCERNPGPSEAGIAIALQLNGLRILSQIPGLLESMPRFFLDEFHSYSVIPEDLGILAQLDQPKKLREETGLGPFGIRRSVLQKKIVEFAQQAGVELKWGLKLEQLEQRDDGVTVTFADGSKDTFSFVVGCDGLHSNTRKCLFGESPADYTGLCQTGGYAPTPERLKGKHIGINLFGDGAHMTIVPIDDETMGFAVTQREPEAKETWRALDSVGVDAFKCSPVSQWAFDGAELVRNAFGIIKYGLYDRPELKTWHRGRVILIGDAAHPTSPHLGQGANQSFEDADMLVKLLLKHNPSGEGPSTVTLEAIYSELEKLRLPRSSEMVKGARAQGEKRVVSGVEECIKRNNFFRELWSDDKNVRARLGAA